MLWWEGEKKKHSRSVQRGGATDTNLVLGTGRRYKKGMNEKRGIQVVGRCILNRVWQN